MQTPMFGQTHMLWHGCKRFNTNFRHWLPSGSEGIRLGLVALTVCSRSFGVVLYIPIHTYCDIDMYILYVQIHICRHLVTAARGWSSVSGRNWERPFFSCFFSIREAHNQLKLTMDQHLSLAGYPSHLKAQPSSLRNAKGFADQNVVSHYRSSISESRPQHDQIRSIISARYMMVYSLVVWTPLKNMKVSWGYYSRYMEK